MISNSIDVIKLDEIFTIDSIFNDEQDLVMFQYNTKRKIYEAREISFY